MILRGQELKKTKTFIRAGILPYTIVQKNRSEKEIYFLFGQDSKTNELCDFGGGIKQNEDCFEGALREFNEESCNIFHKEVDKTTLLRSYAIIDQKYTQILFLVKLDNSWMDKARVLFKLSFNEQKLKDYLENKDIVWLSLETFMKSLQNNSEIKMWDKIKNFINLYGSTILNII